MEAEPVKEEGPGDYDEVRFDVPVTFRGRTFDGVNVEVQADRDVRAWHTPTFLVVTWRGQTRYVPWSNVAHLTPSMAFRESYSSAVAAKRGKG